MARFLVWIVWLVIIGAVTVAVLTLADDEATAWLVPAIVICPALLVLSSVLIFWIASDKGQNAVRIAVAGLAIAVFLPAAMAFALYGERDRLTFLAWYPSHYRQIARFSATDGAMRWRSPMLPDSAEVSFYLVSDRNDEISNFARASERLSRYRLPCQTVDSVERIWRGLYIVTTDCRFGLD